MKVLTGSFTGRKTRPESIGYCHSLDKIINVDDRLDNEGNREWCIGFSLRNMKESMLKESMLKSGNSQVS
jgi:hypothetical protein